MDSLSKKTNCWCFAVKRKSVLENFNVWDNPSVVSVTCFADYFSGRGENRHIKLAHKTSFWRLWDRLRLQNKLDKLKKWSLEKKKKELFNKDNCKLPCRQKCFSKYRIGDYWVSQQSHDVLHPAQMWPLMTLNPWKITSREVIIQGLSRRSWY